MHCKTAGKASLLKIRGKINMSPIHFISGLPRSGSTLLSALLNQNPRFSAAMTSPVASLLSAVQPKMTGGEFSVFFDDILRANIIRGLFESYYKTELGRNKLIFDTNRIWTGKLPLLCQIYPQSKIICCVREIGWILDSIEQMLVKNPLQLSKVFNYQPGTSIYSRVELLMNSEKGLIGLPWSNLREGIFGKFSDRIILVPYKSLAQDPEATVREIYAFIDEPFYKHDFMNVSYDAADYDMQLGMPGLHTVRSKVEYTERAPAIPPDIFMKHIATDFWSVKENINKARVVGK